MGQPKERSAKKNVFVEKYDEIRSFDGSQRQKKLYYLFKRGLTKFFLVKKLVKNLIIIFLTLISFIH